MSLKKGVANFFFLRVLIEKLETYIYRCLHRLLIQSRSIKERCRGQWELPIALDHFHTILQNFANLKIFFLLNFENFSFISREPIFATKISY